MALTLPDGWFRWEEYKATVVSGEVGIVVTGVADHQVVLMGAIVGSDIATVGAITISDGTDAFDLDVSDEQRWLAPNDEGMPMPVGTSMTLKIDVTSGGFVKAWGFLRPSASIERYTAVASIA